MATKGTQIVIDRERLIPAVAFIKITIGEMDSRNQQMRKFVDDFQSEPWAQGERMKVQRDNMAAIADTSKALGELFQQLSAKVDSIFREYLDAESRQMVDSTVSAAAAELKSSGRGKLRKKK